MKLYASLTNSLLGVYYPLPTDDPEIARVMLASSGLKRLWCSVYTEQEVDEQVARFPGCVKLADRFARLLDYDSFAVSQAQKETTCPRP